MNKKIALKIFLWTMVALWMTVIFCFSAQNASDSSQTSGNTIKAVAAVVIKDFKNKPAEEQKAIIESLQFAARKTAHGLIYFVLGALFLVAFSQHNISLKPLWAVSCSVLYSVSDEIHQIFVPGRACQLRDVFIDSFGILCGVLFIIIFTKLFNAIKRKIKV